MDVGPLAADIISLVWGTPANFMSIWRNGGWTKMPLGMELGLSPGDFVFHGT